MCGICGFTQASENDAATLKAMCDVMAHRGPDGEGYYIDPASKIALGHRRLSLIDIAGGSQPMARESTSHNSKTLLPSPSENSNGNGSGKENSSSNTSGKAAANVCKIGAFSIVFNGEIYNYQDLRGELEKSGWEFTTNSDTEVLLVSYIAWGKACLNKLRGMFAFAIWNTSTRELFCARDFFGIKPLYYTQQNGQFIFASEIKSILQHPAYKRELNHAALEAYLCFQFNALPETFFKGIYKLKPAHCMTVCADGTVKEERYWQPEYNFNTQRSSEATVAEIDSTMRQSVRYHNVADVEVGSFLSSGIDSSYMAACLAKENPSIKTFTVGFGCYKQASANNAQDASGKTMRDEISWAAELAKKLDVENNSKYISEEEYWASLPLIQWHMDEPSADPSAVALYFVDQLAATKVKAVLSGEGADEFFGGYRIYQVPFSNSKLNWLPRGVLRAGAKVAQTLGIRGANYLKRASQKPEDWYYTNANGVAFTPSERASILKQPVQGKTPQQLTAPVYARAAGLDDTTRMQYVDLHFWLVDDILLKTDKMAMAHSLESRVPFLDKEVFDVSATIPTPLKANATQTKIALRQAAQRAIPKSWAQKEKLGFPVPIVNWLREEKHYNQVKQAFTSSIAEEFFNTEKLVQLLDEHKQGADKSRKIWIVYMFLMWYKIYFCTTQTNKAPTELAF